MTRDEQRNDERSLQEVLSTLDSVHDAVETVTDVREKLGLLLESNPDEEERLALYHLDMSIMQLDILVRHIAAKMQK